MRFSSTTPMFVLTGLLALAACATGGQEADQASSATSSPAPAPTAAAAAVASGQPEATASPRAVSSPTNPTEAPSDAPGPAVSTQPSPSIAPSPTPSVTPTASAAPAPSVQPSPVMLPQNGPPEILAINMNKTVVHAGDTVTGSIETSSNVASVEVRIANFSISMPKVDVGRFALSYTVPNVPFFLRRTYPMQVIARNSEGAEATQTVHITVR